MVLVTGGTGFIGSYIIQSLIERNYQVHAIRRSTGALPFYISPNVSDKVTWVEGDILDVVQLQEVMEGADTVIHAAGLVSFLRSERQKIYHTNVQGTANVVNAALETKVPRLVHVSSVAALGRSIDGSHATEERKWDNSKVNTHYAISKYRAEIEVWRGIGEGLNAVIINPSTVLGYGDWETSSSRIFKTVYNEFPWYTSGINGFVDVEDVARATVLLMESNISAERFILNGDNWTFERLFTTMAHSFHKKPPHRQASPLLGSIAWRMELIKSLFSGKKPFLTRASARVAQSRTYFENDKILSVLPGFSFTPLQETIQKACNKYLEAINQA